MKGFKDSSGKFHPITNNNGVRKSRDQTTKTEGVRMKRNQKENIISKEDHLRQIENWRENASDLYKIYVNRFPDSHIAMDLKRVGIPSHGHFGQALYEGRYEDAMYRADAENLVRLHELGLENLLSKESKHADDRSPYDEFISRYNWAKESG